MTLRGNNLGIYLHAQVTAMTAGDQVLVIGLTEEPQACVKADQSILESFFDLKLYLPLPDYASRRVHLLPFAGFSSASQRALTNAQQKPLSGACMYIYAPISNLVCHGHTTLNTPDPVRSRKLSRVGPD